MIPYQSQEKKELSNGNGSNSKHLIWHFLVGIGMWHFQNIFLPKMESQGVSFVWTPRVQITLLFCICHDVYHIVQPGWHPTYDSVCASIFLDIKWESENLWDSSFNVCVFFLEMHSVLKLVLLLGAFSLFCNHACLFRPV